MLKQYLRYIHTINEGNISNSLCREIVGNSLGKLNKYLNVVNVVSSLLIWRAWYAEPQKAITYADKYARI